MKAERIQSQIPDAPGWQTQAHLAAERKLQFPTFQEACHFAVQVAERMSGSAPLGLPQIDIRQGEVTLRLVAEQPNVLDAEVALIDELTRVVGALDGDGQTNNLNTGAEG